MTSVPKAEQLDQSTRTPREIEVPSPTAWPLVLSFGFTLLFTGLLTNVSVTVLGAVLSVAGCIGWFREVLPREHEVAVPVVAEQVRAWLPVQTYPISAGVKGGLAGSVAMAAIACAYGVLKVGSIWYPINLLASVVYAQSVKLTPAELLTFHADAFLIALALHGLASTLVGILYGAM